MSDLSNMMKEEVAVGAEEAVVDEGSEVILDLIKEVVGEEQMMLEFVINSEQGRQALKMAAGAILYYLVKSGVIPDLPVSKGKLARLCRVVERNGFRNFVGPHLKTVRSYLGELSEIAKRLPDE